MQIITFYYALRRRFSTVMTRVSALTAFSLTGCDDSGAPQATAPTPAADSGPGAAAKRLQRHGKGQHQGRGAIQLHLRGVEQRQRFALTFDDSGAPQATAPTPAADSGPGAAAKPDSAQLAALAEKSITPG
jgi:hypothetical protein